MRSSKRIVVFGATGGVGSQVVRQALSLNRHVTAVVRTTASIELSHPNLRIVRVSALEEVEIIGPALEGVQAAISCIGPRGGEEGPVASTATSAIMAAMETAGVTRLVVVSAVPVGPIPGGEGLLNRYFLIPLVSHLLRDRYADLAIMERQVQRSDMAWTIVRPPRLVNRPLTGIYRSRIGGNVPRGYSISRANVAHAMLAALDDPRTIRQPIGVAE